MADAHKNFAYSTVATAPSPASSGTSLVVQSGDGTKFPAASFNATVWPASSQPTTANAEIVRVTVVSTDTFTITRAQESSSARTIVVGDQIAATVTVKTLTDLENAMVTSVSAADTSIVVAGTTAPTVRTNTLDVIAAQHAPAADWSNNSHKITSLTNGSAAQDAAAFGQIPTALPPNGAAGGLLAGTYPNPSLATNFPAFPLTEPASSAVVSLPYLSNATSTTVLSTNGLVYYLPLLITAACTVTALTVRVTTAGGTGSIVRLGLFNDNAGQPGTVLLDAGTAATTTNTTTVTIGSLSTALTAGRYWAAAVQQGAPSPAATFLANNGCFSTVTLKTLALAISGPTTYCGRSQTGVTSTFATASPSDWITTAASQTPMVYITF